MRVYLGDLYYDQHWPKGPVPLNAAYVAAYCEETLGSAVEITLLKSPEKLLDASPPVRARYQRFCDLPGL